MIHVALNIHVFDMEVRTSTSNTNSILYSDEKRSSLLLEKYVQVAFGF